MAGKFSFSNFFGVGDEADNYQATAPTTAATSPTNNSSVAAPQATPKVVAMQGGKSVNSKIALFEPRIYSDVKEIATQLINNQAVIVNFDQIADDQAKRIVDFLTGTVYAVEGDIERIGDQIFLCTPQNYEVSGNVSTKFSKSSF